MGMNSQEGGVRAALHEWRAFGNFTAHVTKFKFLKSLRRIPFHIRVYFI